MKKLIVILVAALVLSLSLASRTAAAGGIAPSGGGSKTVGTTFTITVRASGATFDSLQGVISVTGPVTVVSFSAGSATWLPGKSPSNGGQFVGIVTATSSLSIATIKLKGTAVGSGAVTVSGARLALSGAEVGTAGGSAGFTLTAAPNLPGNITATSSTHPDPARSYEATTVTLAWDRPSGVTALSYLIDDAAGTTPAAKSTSNDLTVTYPNEPVGTHYFHIRGQNADGWGATTDFQINIKEPEPKIDSTLKKPSNITVEKGPNFKNNLTDGTVTGVIISGKTEPNFTANLILVPIPTLPDGKTLSAKADDKGVFSFTFDFPIKTGFYKLTAQGQNAKILTPVSDETMFELIEANGGSVTVLTSEDANVSTVTASSSKTTVLGSLINSQHRNAYLISMAVLLMLIVLVLVIIVKKRRKRAALPVI